MKKVVIGSGSAFWGDLLEPAVEMVRRTNVQYMGFDHLAELTMAILNRMRAKNPAEGYIPDLIPWMKAILPTALERRIRVITNAGGANPRQAALALTKLARELGAGPLRIGAVYGDDILPRVAELRAQGWRFENLDTGEPDIDRIQDRLVAANAYIGADHIIAQLRGGADVVVTGRVSDNALFVGPLMHEFGWDYSERFVHHIAAAITVGHLIECSACVTGGMSNHWKRSERPWDIGFPLAEVYENGDAVITKTPGSGGLVDEWTVKEHLLYEIADPSNYLMPDGVADFTALRLADEHGDRVRVTHMRGKPRPATLKVCLGYEDGFIAEGMVFFSWPEALDKAQFAARWIEERLRSLAIPCEDRRIDFVGVNMLHGSTAPMVDKDYNEVGLRLAARTRMREHAEAIRREVTHLWTMGPVGSCLGVPLKVRPVVSLWPALVPREAVPLSSEMIEVEG